MDYAYAYTTSLNTITELFSNGFSLAVNILVIVAWWILFKKANEGGWKILIPFYGNYMQFKVAGCPKLFWATLLVTVGGFFVGLMFILSELLALMVLGIAVILATVVLVVVFQAKYCKKLALAYGKGTGFAVGLFFLAPIFVCIMAFDKSEYQLNHIQG